MSIPAERFDPAAPASTRDGFEILDACHRQTLFTLGKLAALVSRLERHGADAQARDMAAEIGRFFATTSAQHHEDEERHVFPVLVESGDPALIQTVARLRQDHHWLAADWAELAPLLDAVAGGQGWYDLGALHEGVMIFTTLSHDHMALEESIIYPQARATLPEARRSEMSREMAERRRAWRDAIAARSSAASSE